MSNEERLIFDALNIAKASRTALPNGVEGSLESLGMVPKVTDRPVATNTAATYSATLSARRFALEPDVSLASITLPKPTTSSTFWCKCGIEAKKIDPFRLQCKPEYIAVVG